MKAQPVNPELQREARGLMAYLAALEGKGILTGQHTQTREQEELRVIERETGRLPALCGFELLSCSGNIRREGASEACLEEVERNRETLPLAMEWGRRGGIVTFTWHWFSPVGGWDKSFYARNTDFDPDLALREGTEEHRAFVEDMDRMAERLRPFCDAHIPVLWRPFHEAEGDWFWWGRRGPETARALYRFMFRRYTSVHHLNNLIWVWNSPLPEGYVGDDFCDILSRDQYPPPHAHGAFRDKYDSLRTLTADKGLAIAETGILPDPAALEREQVPWLWFMTWSGRFVLTEEQNRFDALRKMYLHPYAVTLDRLPARFG